MSKLSLPDLAALWHAFFSVSDTVATSPTRFPTRGGCSLVHRQAYTPPDPCRQDAARPLQTRRCQTPADKTLPDSCRQDPARPLQTRLCCQTGAAMLACTTARTPVPATTLRSAPPTGKLVCWAQSTIQLHNHYPSMGLADCLLNQKCRSANRWLWVAIKCLKTLIKMKSLSN